MANIICKAKVQNGQNTTNVCFYFELACSIYFAEVC